MRPGRWKVDKGGHEEDRQLVGRARLQGMLLTVSLKLLYVIQQRVMWSVRINHSVGRCRQSSSRTSGHSTQGRSRGYLT